MSTRDRILERRAKFISTALVLAAGCSREQTIATKVPDGEGAKPTPGAIAPVKPGPVAPPKDKPSFEIHVTSAAAERRDLLVKHLEKLHEDVAKLAGSLPAACPMDDAECKARFQAVASEITRIQEEGIQHLFPRCPAKTADDKAIEKAIDEHAAWLRSWLAAIDKAVRGALQGDAGAEWDALLGSAAAAHPQPCLKYYCP